MAKKLIVDDNLDDEAADVPVDVVENEIPLNTPKIISIIFYGVEEADNDLLYKVIGSVVDNAIERGLFLAGASVMDIPLEEVAPNTPFFNAVMRNGE